MTARSDRAGSQITCDTSVLVPALVAWHPVHEVCRSAIAAVRAVPAHVLVECFSVLTRLPVPHRVAPGPAAEVVAALPFEVLGFPPHQITVLIGTFGVGRIRGGAAYDALVAATARHHGLTLLTRDRRASDTYDLMGVRYEVC